MVTSTKFEGVGWISESNSFQFQISREFIAGIRQWTDCIMDRILKNVQMGKFITTALKSLLKF